MSDTANHGQLAQQMPDRPPYDLPRWLRWLARKWGDRVSLTPPPGTGSPGHGITQDEISYLVIRLSVGAIGIALPLVLLVGEAVISGSITARGSISAYYHSSVQNFFVGALSIVAFLLLTYMAGRPRTVDFKWSAIGGAALFGVIFFPTERPGFQVDGPRCGPAIRPAPDGCSVIESFLGETATAGVHFFMAAVFIVSLGLISCAFAVRAHREEKPAWRTRLHYRSAYVIAFAISVVVLGLFPPVHDLVRLSGLTPLYIGEVVAVLSFGISWVVAGQPERLPGVRRLFAPRAVARRS